MSENEDVGARLRRVIARYGTEPVPAAQLYEHFDAKAALPAQGFSSLKPGVYARAVHDEIVQRVQLLSHKGGVYSLNWGVSLAWLPHAFTPKPMYHRTLKAARFDLFEGASTIEPHPGESPADWFVSPHHGPQYMALTCDAMWSRLAPRMHEFLDRVRSPEAVLDAVRTQAQGASEFGRYSCNDPNPLCVHAFTAHRLGHLAEAQEALSRYCRERGEYTAAPHDVLAALLS